MPTQSPTQSPCTSEEDVEGDETSVKENAVRNKREGMEKQDLPCALYCPLRAGRIQKMSCDTFENIFTCAPIEALSLPLCVTEY